MTPEDFDALFDSFEHTVVRLETLPEYRVGGAEAERLAAFHAGRPRPLRSVRNDPWLTRIALTTAAGKSWSRVRVVDDPLTPYQRYQLQSHVEAQACGEEVLIARRSLTSNGGPDFWLFDAGRPGARAVVMDYDEQGRWLGAHLVDDPAEVERLAAAVEKVRDVAVPLNEYLAVSGG